MYSRINIVKEKNISQTQAQSLVPKIMELILKFSNLF